MQVLRTEVENLNFPEWDIFEFVTEKIGRRGPSKQECIQYYSQKLEFYFNYLKKFKNSEFYIN